MTGGVDSAMTGGDGSCSVGGISTSFGVVSWTGGGAHFRNLTGPRSVFISRTLISFSGVAGGGVLSILLLALSFNTATLPFGVPSVSSSDGSVSGEESWE